MTLPQISRRNLIATSVSALAGGVVSSGLAATERPAVSSFQSKGPERKRVLRFAHLTDTHVQTERRGDEGFSMALQHVQQLADPPEWIMFGGDNVMNVDSAAGAEKADEQLATWNRCLKNELSLPHKSCIGNHDVLKLDPVAGKKWAVEAYGLPDRYYSFDSAGWRFVILDSTLPVGGSYRGQLDEAQMDWLSQTLAQTPENQPTMIVSHIPIFAACTFFDGDNEKSGDWSVPGAWMHIDARKIKDLFHKHRQVKAAISGHVHLADEVKYLDVRYFCNGAVSGGWWNGAYQEFSPGYGLVDLFDDGSVECAYVNYPWPTKS